MNLRTDNLLSTIEHLNGDYGQGWLEWLPETLVAEIQNNYGAMEDIDRDRLLAARNLITQGQFWNSVDIFNATVQAFNWVDVEPGVGLHPSPAQIVLAMRLAREIVGPRKVEPIFSDHVRAYIAVVFLDRGYVYIPDEFGLPGVQEHLDRYHQDANLRNAVEAKWRELMNHSWAELEESEVDIQLGRLLAIKKFADVGGVSRHHEKTDALYKIILD